MCRGSTDGNPRRCPGCIARRQDALLRGRENALRRISRNTAKAAAARLRGDDEAAAQYTELIRQARQDTIRAAIVEVAREGAAAGGGGGGDEEPQRRSLVARLLHAISRLRVVMPGWVHMHAPTRDEATGRTTVRATYVDARARDHEVEVEVEEDAHETAVLAAMLRAIDAELAREGANAADLTPRQLELAREHRDELSDFADLTLGAYEAEIEYQDARAEHEAYLRHRWPLTAPPSNARPLTDADIRTALRQRNLDRGPRWTRCQAITYAGLFECCQAEHGAVLTTTTPGRAPVRINFPRLVDGGICGITPEGISVYVPIEEIGSLHPDGDIEAARASTENTPGHEQELGPEVDPDSDLD